MFYRAILTACLLCLNVGCDYSQRITRLEKDNKDLQSKVSRQEAAIDYDLQAKCAKDSRTWFLQNWQKDNKTLLLDYTNHYNRSRNICFILVQYNRSMGRKGEFVSKDLIAHDIYENVEHASGGTVEHVGDPDYKDIPRCSIENQNQTVKSFQDCFNKIWATFMTN